MKRFVRVCVGSTALALGVAVVPALAAGVAQASSSQLPSGGVSAPRVVNMRAVTREGETRHPELAAVARYFNPSAVAANRAAAIRSGGRHSGLTALAARNAVQAGSPGQTWDDFPVMSLSEQLNVLGSSQGFQPPDTQLAAGPGALVEATNDSLSVWSKTGSLLGIADLNAFFPVPSTQSFTDPRVLYDNQAGVWILSGWSLDSAETNTGTYVAVSQNSNPLGSWNVYTIATSSTGVLTDQPMTGVCDDKVVVAWNEYTGSGATFSGAQALVLQKSVLTAGTSLAAADEFLFTSATEFRFVPAQSLSATTTCFMAVNNADSANLGGNSTTPALGVYAITGTPAASDVSFNTEAEVAIPATSEPPDPLQPSGTTNDTVIDDRLVSAVWQNGVLATSATDACTPTGDTATRDCLRLDEVNAPGTGTPTLALDTELSAKGMDEYYPAVGFDSAGNLYASYSASSSTVDPGAYAVVSAAASPGTFSPPVAIQAGKASYNGGTGARWGDYSAVALDPAEAGTVWASAEYAPSDAAQGDWATATAMISLTAPPPAAIAMAVEGTGGVPYAQAPQLGTGWHSLGGKVAAPPAVAAAVSPYATTPAKPIFIATGTNKLLYIKAIGGSWQRVGPQTMACLGSPAAVIIGSTLVVACQGTNHALYYNTATVPALPALPQFTSAWTSLGGVLTAGPAVAPVGGINGTLTFFVRGTNGRIYTRTLATGFAASPWTCIGAPAAAAEGASADTIFACQGTNHALYVAVNGGIGWTGAVSLGGVLTAGPALAATSRIPYFLVEGKNSALFKRTLATGFTGLGGTAIGGIGAVALN